MSIGIRRLHQAVDFDDLVRRFEPAPEYFERGWLAPPEEIERTQLVRLGVAATLKRCRDDR